MTWFDQAVAVLSDGSTIACEAGHPEHTHKVVSVDNGTSASVMVCFDAAEYADTHGYCPGDDDVSRTLALYGKWEPAGTAMFRAALANDDGPVIDFGTHVGWYTLIALAMGREVLAVEAVVEHEQLTLDNAVRYGYGAALHQAHCWIDENTPRLPWTPDAPMFALAKVDLEGNDRHAVTIAHDLIYHGNVRNIMLECSPCFNDTYGDLLRHLVGLGYRAAVIDPWQPFTIDDIDRLLEPKQQFDVILALEPWWDAANR